MSPEAQRIAIAKSVGIHLHDGDHAPSNYMFATDLPDYLNDLNAMHEAELKLGPVEGDTFSDYHHLLRSATGSTLAAAIATAAQRAEAYLKTIGKWKELQPQSIA